jgi:hypothetical protein
MLTCQLLHRYMAGVPKAAYEQNTPILGTPYFARDIAMNTTYCPWWYPNWGQNVNHSHPGQFVRLLSLPLFLFLGFVSVCFSISLSSSFSSFSVSGSSAFCLVLFSSRPRQPSAAAYLIFCFLLLSVSLFPSLFSRPTVVQQPGAALERMGC